LAYLFTIHSLIFGVAFLVFDDAKSVRATLLYQSGALVGVPAWGVLVTLAASVLLYGLIRLNKSLVIPGGIGMFMAWIFATITYFMNGNGLQGILAIVLVLMFGYFVVAATMDRLWHYTPPMTPRR
jgi:hypothetical protein